jgi:hypothetical protein
MCFVKNANLDSMLRTIRASAVHQAVQSVVMQPHAMSVMLDIISMTLVALLALTIIA